MVARLTLALLFLVPAALAYPWYTVTARVLLAAAVVVVIVVFAWWQGLFVTTMISRRIALWRRRGKGAGSHQSSDRATVAIRIGPRDADDLPVNLLIGYLDRYGIDFDMVRLTIRHAGGMTTMWVSLTAAAADNVAALQARSARLPLHDTVELAARRLADHLRETGWEVYPLGDAGTVALAQGKETWRGVADEHGYVAAYRITVDDRLPDVLASLRRESDACVALQLTGSRAYPEIAVACAVRTAERPAARAPQGALTAERGMHGPALAALEPDSGDRLFARPAALTPELVGRLRRPEGSALSRT
jgi:type VII secretion protein EccE